MALDRYRPSGFFRPTVIVFFLIAIVAGVATAWLYQLLVRWIPFIYINLIICVGFGGVIGFFGYLAVQKGHCRNAVMAVVLALPLGVASLGASYYWGYSSFLSSYAEDTKHTVAEVKEEVPFQKYLELRQEAGWKLRGSTLNGVFVLIIWGIEALLVLGMAIWITAMAAYEPYCEKCNVWCNSAGYMVGGVSRTEAAPLIDRGDLAALVKVMPPAEPDPRVNLTLEIAHCAACKDTTFLSVTEKRTVEVRKGKTEEKKETLLKHAVLSGAARTDALARLAAVTAQKA